MSDNQKNRDRSRTDDNELDEDMTYNDKNRYMSEKGIDSSSGLLEREVGGQGGRMMHQSDQDRNNQSGQRDRTTNQHGGQNDRDRSGSQSGSGQDNKDRDRGSQSGRDNKKGRGRG